MLPGISIYVHDAYLKGKGLLRASALGLFTVANQQGDKPLAEGELMRFLAEAPWYPTSLLPRFGVKWDAVDEASARATLEDGEIRASLLFRFDKEHLITSVYAEARNRSVANKPVPTPWEGRWKDYEKREGMLIPTGGEACWVLPETVLPYWRGSIDNIQFTFLKPDF